MARILIRGELFDSVSPGALFEADYESLLIANAPHLFPGYHIVRFDTPVSSGDDTRRADLALIHETYKAWWVVEVEMARHSLEAHVEPQVRCLATGTYGIAHATALSSRSPSLDAARVWDMIRGEQPRVLVLVDRLRDEWIAPLQRLNVLIGIVEVFRSERGLHALRLDGSFPPQPEDVLTACRVDKLLPNLLVVASPGGLGAISEPVIELEYKGGVTRWERIDSATQVWLQPTHRWPLDEREREFVITATENQRYRLVPKRPL